jgi:peptidoglycan hydrolase-like protein with peptidoglycan-binding domain
MKLIAVFLVALVYTAVSNGQRTNNLLGQPPPRRNEVVAYLIDYGYLTEPNYTPNQLRRSLRQFQRENNLVVNGRITPEVNDFVENENEKRMVVEYLKRFGYIDGHINPLKTTNAVKKLQQNSGVLDISGLIDTPTVNFIKTHQHGYSEGLFAE